MDRWLGRLLLYQLPNPTRASPKADKSFNPKTICGISYPFEQLFLTLGQIPTRYSAVRRSCTPKGLTARLACVKHAASIHPEPGSNSPLKCTRNTYDLTHNKLTMICTIKLLKFTLAKSNCRFPLHH